MSSIVVADAGPLHYLILIDCADTLANLFDRVLIPTTVRDELAHSDAPRKVKDWLTASRSWLSVEAVNPIPLAHLHRGEAEALQLALQIKAAGVLMDDLDGRAEARRLGCTVIGTVGLLERAAEKGLLELPATIARLRATNFFASEELLAAALARDRQRRKS